MPLLRQAGEAAADEAELITDGQGSAAYKKQLVRVYVARALRAALAQGDGSPTLMATQHDGERAGRALGACGSKARPRSPAAPNTCTTCGCPACSTARSSAARSRTAASSSIDVSAARALEGVHRVVTIDDVRKVIPNPFYGPAFHDQPILAAGKVHYVGEPVAVVLAADPHVAEAAAQLIVAEYEELPAVFDEVEAMTSKAIVHDELKPAGTFPDLKHLQGQARTPMSRSISICGAATRRPAFAAADHVFEHTFRTQQVLHLPLEPFVSIGEPTDTGAHHPYRLAVAVVRAHRDRAAARLAGEQGAREGAVSRRRLRRASSTSSSKRWWRRWRCWCSRPVKISLTMEEQFYTLTKHASTFRIKSGVKDGRITARECEVWWNGGAYADIGPRITQKSGFTAPGPYDIENVSHRFLLALHQPAAGRRAARLRHSAARVGLREPHRHDGARAQARSGRVPAQEPPARRPPAGDRHADEGRRDRGGARSPGAAHELAGAVRSRQRHR